MTRLPIPGSDDGSWGDILNDFLSQAHNSDGSLKAIAESTVTNLTADLASKASTSHTHTESDVTGLATDLSAKTDKATLTTKGDLYAATATSTPARLGVGSDYQHLLADSTTSTGLKWATKEFVNVKDYSATGDGSTDDTAAIQAAINGSSIGATIFFPLGTYIVSTTITLKPKRYYVGSSRDNSMIKQATGANLNAVLASEAWLSTSGSATADSPTYVRDLGVDGNKTNQTSGTGIGLVTMTFWNDISRLLVQNTRGDGIRLTDTRQDGSVLSTNTAVENHIFKCDVRHAGGHGFRIFDSGASQVTDGWIIDCIVHDAVEDGIHIDSSEGWLVQGNHVYAMLKNGIFLGRGYFTRCMNNYVETFGSSSTTANYSGIAFGDGTTGFISAQGPIVISGNVVRYTGGAAAGSFIRGIRVSTGTGHTSEVVVSNNGLHGATHTLGSIGIVIANQSSTAVSNVAFGTNYNVGWDTPLTLSASSGVINTPGIKSKTIIIQNPTNIENITLLHADYAMTIIKVQA